MIFNKFWEKLGNIVFLGQYARVLKLPKILKDMKNFHTCNMFFKLLIDVYVIALVIEKSSQKKINKFQA